MTVNGIWDWALLNARKINVNDLRKKTLAIDGHIWLYESVKGSQTHYKTESTYLITFFKRLMKLVEQNIKPVVVFDSLVTSPSTSQDFCQRKRRSSCYGEQYFTDFSDKVLKCQALLHKMGIKMIYATRDGEAQCAQLEVDGIVDGCITTDFDYFLFGGKNLYRIVFEDNLKDITHISIKDLAIDEKRVTRNSLVSLAILLGCDYFEKGVKGIGIATGLEAIGEFGGNPDDDPSVILDRFCSYVRAEVPERPKDSETKQKLRKRKFQFPEGFPNSDSVFEAISIYLQPKTTLFKKEEFHEILPQKMAEVEKMLRDECGWTPEKMNKEKKLPQYFLPLKKPRYQPVVEKCSEEEYKEETRKYAENRKRKTPQVIKPNLPRKRRSCKISNTNSTTSSIILDDSPNSSIEIIQID
ncbi:unnamed protein product [Caenorhabditis angaria]|uniref:XPG-I domain-containing protein n=1 Tax=Caenorhabditis angaria TaxID=860376 RepID=A0A9P1IHG6_9PELO|nr:unnamed protein product [Caenorhabditis angaria]